MDYAFVAVAAAAVRRKAKHQSEMTNQFLFGEPVKILKDKKKYWLKVRSLHDNYEGWLTANLLIETDEHRAKASHAASTTRLFTSILVDNEPMIIPFGSTLPGFENGTGTIGDLSYSCTDDGINTGSHHFDPSVIEGLSRQWLHVPYLWGGKTAMGVDCSGFVQLLYKMAGIMLPRDAWQQAQEGTMIGRYKDAVPGDLAFFDDKDEIVHVGILLGNDRIIHSSGTVRIDQVDKRGIINTLTGKRTHSLRVIKRHQ